LELPPVEERNLGFRLWRDIEFIAGALSRQHKPECAGASSAKADHWLRFDHDRGGCLPIL
jgi:hypothetical protein